MMQAKSRPRQTGVHSGRAVLARGAPVHQRDDHGDASGSTKTWNLRMK
jgi:hypothetical protein